MSNMLTNAEENIRKYRKRDLTVQVKAGGKPVENCQVNVKQKKHEFLFGANCFWVGSLEAEKLEKYTDLFINIFNYATLPFYWGSYEKEKGITDEDRLNRIVEWCDKNNLEKKGHPLHWHEVVPKWLFEEKPEDVEGLIIKRVGDIIDKFRNKIKLWDVVNEIAKSHMFKDPISLWEVNKGEANVVKMLVELVHSKDPEAKLLLNECHLQGNAFEDVLRKLKDEGVPLYAVGLQSHMHDVVWTVEHTWEMCERFSKFGWPLHFTELSILSGKCNGKVDFYSQDGNQWITGEEFEEFQAQHTRDIYTVLFSHPAVEAVTWWDIVDGNWLRAPSGLVTEEFEPKKAYYTLKDLVRKEWWTEVEGVTNAAGEFKTNAFYGEYEVCAVINGRSVLCDYRHSKNNTGDSIITINA